MMGYLESPDKHKLNRYSELLGFTAGELLFAEKLFSRKLTFW